ncbi:MAG: DUF3179 domain-containing protein [Bacteroidota bacterium]
MKMIVRYRFFSLVFLLGFLIPDSFSQPPLSLNGFVILDPLVPANEIRRGGPPRDGIPPIEHPRFLSVAEAEDLMPEDKVLGVVLHGIAKAYPISILDYHEVVNDVFADQMVSVTYCPLCGSGVAVDGRVGDASSTFGVSGLLYNSDVLLYDRATESLWSQLRGEAINGPQKGTPLTYLPTTTTSWGEWKTAHPETLVLSRETGFARDYDRYPYKDYATVERLYFPVAHQDKRFHPKEWVIGIEHQGVAKAYPLSLLAKHSSTHIQDKINGKTIDIRYNPKANSAQVFDSWGNQMETITLFWFAWAAFHPETQVWNQE